MSQKASRTDQTLNGYCYKPCACATQRLNISHKIARYYSTCNVTKTKLMYILHVIAFLMICMCVQNCKYLFLIGFTSLNFLPNS